MCTKLCEPSRGVFESKRATCLCDKAVPSIGSTSHLLPVHHRISCLLAKSWHHHVVVHQRAPGISSAPTLTTANLKARFDNSRRRRLSQHAAPAPIPSHGRREGTCLAPHTACWAVLMAMAAAHAALAAGLGAAREL